MTIDGNTKIVVHGPPLAGKTTILHALHEQFGGDLAVNEVVGKNAEQFPDRVLSLSSLIDGRHAELVTVPGGNWDVTAWDHLFDSARATIAVLDGQVTCLEANMQRLVYLSAIRETPLRAVMVTKEDLAEQGVEMWEYNRLRLFLEDTDIHIFRSRSDVVESLLTPVLAVLEEIQ